jgi:putative glutamine amidotransferase
MRPIVGITCDTATKPGGRIVHESPRDYAGAVDRAGGIPLLLPHATEHLPAYLSLCHAFVMTGGNDPATEPFGRPTHPAADVIDPARQRFETELLNRLGATDHPVLGICLGMQLMALHHGGRLDQHLPDSSDAVTVERHADGDHAIEPTFDGHPLLQSRAVVHSHHHQAVADAGSMRVVAVCPDDQIVEAIDLPGPRYYLGVQWHPERTEASDVGDSLFEALVRSARRQVDTIDER